MLSFWRQKKEVNRQEFYSLSMSFPLQILFFLLTWLNLSATPVLPKVTSPSYTISFPKTENQNLESEVKIDVLNSARNGISENSSFQKAVLCDSYVLENRAREGNVWDVQGAGISLGALDVLLGAGTKTKINNWEPEEPQPLFDVLDLLEDLHNYQQQENPNEISGIEYTNLTSFIDNARANPTEWLDSKLGLRMNLIASLDLLGAFSRYSYSLEDLVYRENSSFKHVILQRESEGIATPIDPIASSTQYLNKWDTDCAFFLGFEYMKMYVETVFEPVMVANVISRFSKLTKTYKSFKLSRGDIDDLLKRNGGVKGAGKIIPKSVDEIKALLKTDNGTSFFWSGRTNGIGGEIKALEIAKSRGGTTLEGLLKEKNIELPPWNPSNPNVTKLWEDVSEEYAKQVSGEVRAVIGSELRPGNIWQAKELDALKSNINVTKITTIDPVTLIESIIFTR